MSHDMRSSDSFDQALREMNKHAIPITDNKGERIVKLIRELDDSIRQYDLAYPTIIEEAERRGIKLTVEKLQITVRNELRQRGFRIPETIRWELRAALGGFEEHE